MCKSCALIFVYSQRCRGNAIFLGLANSFSGGIFLGIGLFHLLPESVEIIDKQEGSFLKKMPFPFFLAFCSYCLILFVEKIAFDSHSLISHEHGHELSHEHDHAHNDKEESKDDHNTKNDAKVDKSPLIPNNQQSKEFDTEEVVKNLISSKGHFSSFLFLNNSIINNEPDGKNLHNKSLDLIAEIDGHGHDHVHAHGVKQTTWITPYILLIAIGLHGFFEGVAFGIQRTIEGSTFLLIAILAHKWAESLTLGISFVKANTPKKPFIGMGLLFSFIGPIGIILGLILERETNELVEGIFLGISTGTFLYVACSEVVVEEFSIGRHYGWKFVLFVIAGIFTFGLALLELLQWEEEEPSKLGM